MPIKNELSQKLVSPLSNSFMLNWSGLLCKSICNRTCSDVAETA